MKLTKLLMVAAAIALAIGYTPAPVEADGNVAPTGKFHKSFSDNGDRMVTIEGALHGEGVVFKNNLESVWCFHRTNECTTVHIDADGLAIISVTLPIAWHITRWDSRYIQAETPTLCGTVSMLTIDRATKSADMLDRSCVDGKGYLITIEDPPSSVPPLMDQGLR